MKIALPSRQNLVDDHFGHCEYFTVIMKNPFGCQMDFSMHLKSLFHKNISGSALLVNPSSSSC